MTTSASSPTDGEGIGRRSFSRSVTLVGAGIGGGGVVAAVGVRTIDGRSASAQGAREASAVFAMPSGTIEGGRIAQPLLTG